MAHAARLLPPSFPQFRTPAWRSELLLVALTFLALHPYTTQAQDLPPPQPPAAASSTPPFPVAMTREVLAAALGFLIPRTLDAHSPREFCLWGLDGLTAIDPSITVTVSPPDNHPPQHIPETLTVTLGQKVLFKHPVPTDNNRVAWADLVTNAMQAAWQQSQTLQGAGNDALFQGFFDELFNHMDPYSRYLSPTPATADRTKRVGQPGTVGLTVGQKGRAIIITAVNANGPAWEAGIDAGLHLLSVNGNSTRGQTAETVQNWLNGDNHTTITLSLSAPGHRATNVTLHREEVPPETVFASSEGRYTLLRITSFSTHTAEEISQYLDQIMGDSSPDTPSHDIKPLPGIIIDLRGDRGGVLQQAVTTAALFLDHGIAVTTHGRDPQANHIWAVQGGDMTQGTPIVILVDGRTASAAEILSAALADHRRAVVVGSETLGKGLVQVIGQMPNGAELFVTWSRNQAPLGWPIQGLGVMPQVCTSLSAKELAEQMKALKKGTSLQTDLIRQARSARYPVATNRILDLRRECPAALGTDADMETAKSVLASASAYKAALESVPDENLAPLH